MGVLSVCIMCNMCMPDAHGGQKVVLDPLDLELQLVNSKPPRGCWDLNLNPLQGQQVLYLLSLLSSSLLMNASIPRVKSSGVLKQERFY